MIPVSYIEGKHQMQLGPLQQLTIGLSVASILSISQAFIPIWVVPSVILAAALLYVILRNDKYTLIAYTAVIIAVRIRERQTGISPIDIFAGFFMTAILLRIFIQRKFFQREQIVKHHLLYPVLLFSGWALFFGLLSIFRLGAEFEWVYREFLTFSPLLFIPILFKRIGIDNKKDFPTILAFLLTFWLIAEVASVLIIRKSVQSVVFLYETGHANFDVMRPSIAIFLFISLVALPSQWKYRLLYGAGLLLAVLGLILTFNRTAWLLTLSLLPVLILTTPRLNRKNAIKFLLTLLGLILLVATISYFSLHLVQMLMQWAYTKFLSSSNLKSDASLFNRYVEWRYTLKQILQTPISGVGFAGRYHEYEWIKGSFRDSFYTHSGFLGILLKSGIVGFILLGYAHIRFFLLGIKHSLSQKLTVHEKVFSRIGLFIIILTTLHGLTLNPLMHREFLWYVGMTWGYYIYLERKTNLTSRSEISH
ncbi:MAG: O-antigen ligase family protein [bacterium]